MKKNHPTRLLAIGLPLLAAALLAGCAAGDPRFAEGEPAGFLYGLWHGFIIVVTFVISLFSDNVAIYEAHNTGGWYDLGFVLGVLLMGGGCASPWKKKRRKPPADKEWEDLGRKVGQKVMREVRKWADEECTGGKAAEEGGAEGQAARDAEWEETGRLVEQKIKRKLRQWAEED